MDPNMPSNYNIYATVALGALVWLLAQFHIVLPDSVDNAILAALPPVMAAIVAIFHWLNQGTNAARAKAFAAEEVGRALDRAKKSAHTFIVAFFVGALLLGSGMLQGCSAITQFFGGNSAATTLGDTLTVFTAAQTTYLGLCNVPAPPSYCVSAKVSAKVASGAGTLALQQALAAYEVSGDTNAVEELITQAVTDLAQWQALVNSLNAASGRKGNILTDITIAEQVIAIGTQVYQEIVALNSAGTPTNAELDDLLAQAQANNTIIQQL